jgi:endonuclease/exonuclease/phosphatase family metal-dependent hydrolase
VVSKTKLLTACIGAFLASCAHDLAGWNDWQPWEEISGWQRPEVQTSAKSPPAPVRLRVVSFNVERADHFVRLAQAIQGNVELLGADVLLLQEVESHPDEPRSRARALAARLGYESHVYAPARQLDGGGTHGLAILSRFPIRRVEVMQLPYYDLHISSTRRIALSVTLDIDGTPLRVINVHLDTRININQRLRQIEPVVALTEGALVMGGDFNTNPFAWVQRTVPLPPANSIAALNQAEALDRYMRANGFSTPTAGLGSTTNMTLLEMRLDAIYCRRVKAVDARVERDVDVSDHLPLWIDLSLGE